MSNEKKMELLAEVLDCDPDDFTAETSLTSLENWDSMTMLSLIVMMDDECGKTLTRAEIDKFNTIGDVMAYMG